MKSETSSTEPDTTARLSELQLAVMHVLWQEGEATTAVVHERAGKPRSLAYTTVSTLLTRLEARGFVRSEKRTHERTFVPLVSESVIKHSMVAEFVGSLFAGNPQALVSHLIKECDIGQDDINAVRVLLDEHSARQPQKDP